MSVSLAALGAILGKTSNVVLTDLVANPYSRTFAGSGYRRVNPFQVNNGIGDVSAPLSLAAWEGYDQDALNRGTNLEVTMGYGQVTIQWTNPSGYSLAPSILTCRLYVRSMGVTEDLSVNPFSSADKTQDGGDGGSAVVTLASFIGEFVAIGAKVEFDDSVDVYELADSLGFTHKSGQTPLLGAGVGISSGEAVWATAPSIDDVIQLTDPGSCVSGCTGCVDVQLNVTMEGGSSGRLERRVDGGSWSLIDGSVTAGSSSLAQDGLDAGKLYEWRLRYNDISPDDWSTTEGITTECTLV